MVRKRYFFSVILSIAGVIWTQSTAPAQGQNSPRPVVREATRTDTTAPLRHMPELPPTPAILGQIFERPRKLLPNREGSIAPLAATDPVLQAPVAEPGAPTTGPDFEGVGNVNGVLPPDTVGDIGPSHYVQMVNLSFAIYNRSGNKLYGPVNTNTLWQGFGGPCESTNDGDPIVLYDHLADRWMMSQFALPSFPRGPFYQCIAVSQAGDPLGAWHRYEFLISQSKLNDYPKFGVWPDGYYMSINQYKCRFISCSWAGQGVVAFERDKMLNGQQAQMVYFDLETVDSNLGGMLPSDLDGPAPPAGAPNYFAQVDDHAWGYSPDQLQIWDFHVDWSNPGSSTFTKWGNLGTAAFDSNMCSYSRNCVPQSGTSVKVDALSDRLMFRLQYRNFGAHQTLMVNHTVDVNGSDRAGIRWYELRKSGAGWSIHQQGTFSPDSTHRWMGSIAMNSMGDAGLGYSISSTSVFPSIRATGRLSEDSLGQMTQGEISIVNGSGHQTHSSGRWGDYSSMSVDPADDCTFWYTQEYYAVSGSAPWRTRIGSFKLRDCAALPTPPNAPNSLQATAVSSSQIDLAWNDSSDNEDGFRVRRCQGSSCTPTQVVATLAANSISHSDTGLSPNTPYTYAVVAFNPGGESDPTNTASATTDQIAAPNAPTGLSVTAVSSSQINLSWTDASNNEEGFRIERCTGSVCTPSTVVATVGAGVTSYNDSGLTANTTYRYHVVAFNAGGESTSNQAGATTQAAPAISLSATGYKVKGLQKADLSWTGATTANVDVYRNGSLIATTANDGFHTDNINNKGGGSYTYKVCEQGTAICSNNAVVTF